MDDMPGVSCLCPVVTTQQTSREARTNLDLIRNLDRSKPTLATPFNPSSVQGISGTTTTTTTT
ncbi:uncharacterized protein LY79DRAFT_478826, partial [Colletotrichum navitas]